MFDAGADGSRTIPPGPPRAEQTLELAADLCEVGQRPLNVLQLQVHEVQHVRAGRTPRPLQGGDPLDLVQPEAKAPRLRDEQQKGQGVGPVDAVACGSAPRWRQDTRPLVQAEGLPAPPPLGPALANQQPVPSPAMTLNPPP